MSSPEAGLSAPLRSAISPPARSRVMIWTTSQTSLSTLLGLMIVSLFKRGRPVARHDRPKVPCRGDLRKCDGLMMSTFRATQPDYKLQHKMRRGEKNGILKSLQVRRTIVRIEWIPRLLSPFRIRVGIGVTMFRRGAA